MKNSASIIAVLMIWIININSQDMFNPKQLTFDPAQEGFATWSPDSKFLVFQHTNLQDTTGKNGLWRISPDGTGAKQIYSGIAEHAKWSPDGRFIVFDADTGQSIKMILPEGGDPITFLPDRIHINKGGLPCWSPDASNIAFKDSSYSLCIYDMKTEKTSIIYNKEGALLLPGCWSRDGTSVLVALMDRQSKKSTIWSISADGRERKQITGHHERFYRYLDLSPDGSLLVYGAKEGKYLGLFIMPLKGGISIPLAVSPLGHNEGSSWSPDGKKIAFTSTRSGNFDIWMMELDIAQVKKKLRMRND